MNLIYNSACETGLSRGDNQDSVYCNAAGRVFLVADGMGGGSEGGKASGIVRSWISDLLDSPKFDSRADGIRSAIKSANREIFEYAKSRGLRQMGSTAVLLAFGGPKTRQAAVCHVGDSRAYRLRAGALELLTRDHSVGEELRGMLGGSGDSFAKRSNPLAHVLTRAVGVAEEVECDWKEVDVAAGDRFLLCSDGVHDVLGDDDIKLLLAGDTPKACVKAISEAVVKGGAPDNYSVVVVFVEE